jgi:protein gp37
MKMSKNVAPVVAKPEVKQNCWEFKKCGRQPGGQKVADLGVCPATVHQPLDGAHEGKNAGRSCWVVAGSLCGGKIQGTYAQKLNNCWRCEFMNMVKKEEEPTAFGFSHTRLGMEKTLEKKHHHGNASVDDAIRKNKG